MTDPTNTLPTPYQSVRLKPCPCGSEDIQHSYGQIDGNVKGYTILCRDCGYYVEDCEDKSAVEKWNRHRRFTDTREYRAWVRAVTELSTAIHAMDNVPFLGMGPETRAECKDIRDRMDDLKSEMVRRIEQMEGEE